NVDLVPFSRGVIALNGIADAAGDGGRALQADHWNNPNLTGVRSIALAGGRLYAGGSFNRRLAALDAASGAVSGWDPMIPGGTVRAVAATAGGVFAGGTFDGANAVPRAGLAALDSTGAVVGNWHPAVSDGGVRALALNGSQLYLGGTFTAIDGTPRSKLA